MGGTNLHSWPDAAFERTLSPAGMSAYGIAAELNRRKVSAEVNGIPWRAQRNIPVGPGRYILTAVNARAATLGRTLGRQLICALDFVLYRFREAQPHPREPEPTHPLSTSLPRRRRAIPAYLLATSFTADCNLRWPAPSLFGHTSGPRDQPALRPAGMDLPPGEWCHTRFNDEPKRS